MTSENLSPPPSTGSRIGQAIVSLVRVLVRLLLVIILAVALGVGIYWGIPALYRRYVQPVERNLSSLNDAQARQQEASHQLEQRLDSLQERLEDLELQNDTHKQTLDELGSRLGGLEAEAQSGEEEEIASRLDDVDAALQAMGADLEQAQKDLAGVNEAMAQNDLELQDLAAQAEMGATPLQELRNELQVVKAMEHLTRSRLFLVENNLGLAEQDVGAARFLLVGLQGEVPEEQVETLEAVISWLDSALDNLPARPILAAQDIEAAWQLLRFGLAGEPTPQPTPTAGAFAGTPTP
jgi:chromosome segregation ATPase